MTALRIACISIICLVSLWLLALPFAYIFDPFDDPGEGPGWEILFIVGYYIILLLGAIGVLQRKTYAWWTNEVALVAGLAISVITQASLGLLFAVWLVMFSVAPPWRWQEK